jgi:peptidoglycan-associated lipoprotein
MSFGVSQRSVLALASVLLIGASACSKKTVQMPESTPQTTRAEPEKIAPPMAEAPASIELKDIYFEFDQSRIRSDAMNTLNANGKALLADPTVRVTLEGHCDERGTVEYNLALGDRRARSSKDYLVSYGIDAARLSTVSYGEERPFVQGHVESAWSQNRRVHFVKGGQAGAQASQSN